MGKITAKQENTDFISREKTPLCFPWCSPWCFQRNVGIGKVKQENRAKITAKQRNE